MPQTQHITPEVTQDGVPQNNHFTEGPQTEPALATPSAQDTHWLPPTQPQSICNQALILSTVAWEDHSLLPS